MTKKENEIFQLGSPDQPSYDLLSAVGCEQLTTNRTENLRQEITQPESRLRPGKGILMSNFRIIGPGTTRKRITNWPSHKQPPWQRSWGRAGADFLICVHSGEWSLYGQSWDGLEWKLWTD